MKKPSLLTLLAVFLFPFSLLAENVLEMRYVLEKEAAGAIQKELDGKPVWLSSEIVISDADVVDASVVEAQGWGVLVKFTDAGAARFNEQAAKHYQQKLAIVVKGEVISAPVIMAKEFGGSVQIAGRFTQQAAQDLVAVLQPKAGAKAGPKP